MPIKPLDGDVLDHNLKCVIPTLKDISHMFHATEATSCSSVTVESTLGLPYHIPEPKTIDQFFKKRARPEGPAMALLK